MNDGMNERVLIAGALLGAPVAATRRGAPGLRECRLEVPLASGAQTWPVLLATPEAARELDGLGEGAIVVCTGWATRPRFPGDPLARILSADGALSLRDSRAATQAAPAPMKLDAFNLLLDKLAACAHVAGAACERARISAILNGPLASANMLMAWRLAERGDVSREAAEEALTIAHFAGLTPAAGASGSVLEN